MSKRQDFILFLWLNNQKQIFDGSVLDQLLGGIIVSLILYVILSQSSEDHLGRY